MFQAQCGRDVAESRALLREREENARREQERRAKARQRIELELRRTQQELEAEDDDEDPVPPPPPLKTVPKTAASSTSLDFNTKELPPPPPLSTSQPPYGQQRRGSLDSLLNPYESIHSPKEESSVSKEPGGEFSKSLTSTFDKKWRMLHQLPAPRQPDRLPPFKPSQNSGSPRPFRDPSLHRHSPKPEDRAASDSPQVGIAFRMERPATNLPRTTNVYASKPPELGLSLVKDKGAGKERDDNASAQQYAAALRKSTEKLYGSRENILSAENTGKQPISTPQPMKRRKNGAGSGKKVKQRRHTVGGSSDLEHFKALVSVVGFGKQKLSPSSQQSTSARPSAWERLQPLTPDDDSRDVQSWLQRQQKLRQCRSTPSLLDPLLFYRHAPTFSPTAHGRARRGQPPFDVLSSSSGSSSPSVQLQPPFAFESSI